MHSHGDLGNEVCWILRPINLTQAPYYVRPLLSDSSPAWRSLERACSYPLTLDPMANRKAPYGTMAITCPTTGPIGVLRLTHSQA